MPVSCVAFGCQSRFKKGQSIHFFRFPLDEELQKRWVTAIKRKNFNPSQYSRVCSVHFTEHDYQIRPDANRPLLKTNAVPSVFPSFPSYYQTIKTPRKEPAKRIAIQVNKSVDDDINSDQRPDDIATNNELNNCSGTSTRDVEVQTTNSYTNEMVLKNKIKILQQKLRRKDKKINNLKDLVNDLRSKGLIDGEPGTLIENYFSGSILNLFQNELNNSNKGTGCRYSKEMKEFALTLHYYSPKAYNFCRTIMSLPHPSSVRDWTSSVDAKPGFLHEVFEHIKRLPSSDKDCNLVFDAMSIRKNILYDASEDRFYGYCDFGGIQAESKETEATEALVFMLVSLNGKWKWPIGYFLQHKSTAIMQAGLVTTAIIMAKEAGVRVWGVTCDGTSTNLSTMTHLGCKLHGSFDELVEYFYIPGIDQKIYYIPDACHNMKLARNALGTYQKFKSEAGIIDWSFIQDLNKAQENIGLHLANKLTSTHIDWRKNIMKVKFAAQTLSSSTAAAIEFFRTLKDPNFQKSEATEEFIRVIDRLFDFLNSRNPFAKGFKKPLYKNDLDQMRNVIMPLIKYLWNLTDIKGTPIHSTPRKTFVIGFTIAVKSIFNLAEELFNVTDYKYLLTFKFSQDHLEIFFSKVRQRFGNNNNPNVLEFRTALRQLLLKNLVTSSYAANCIALDNSSQDSIFEIRWKKRKSEDMEECDEEIPEHLFSFNESMNVFKENILYYICGFIVRNILKKIDCPTCTENLLETPTEHNYFQRNSYATLVKIKNRGGLVSSSPDVLKIIKYIENYLIHLTDNFNSLTSGLRTKIVIYTKNYVHNGNIFKNLNCTDQSFLENHKLDLVTLICKQYLKIRLHYIAKSKSHQVSKRRVFTKLILFNNQ